MLVWGDCHRSPAGLRRWPVNPGIRKTAERIKGAPLEIAARMEKESILFRTLALFGGMAVLVVLTFAGVIWLVKSRPVRP